MGYLHDNVGKRTRVPLRPSHSLISQRYIPAWINENIAFLIESAPCGSHIASTLREDSPVRGRMVARVSRSSDFNDDLVACLVAR